MDFGEEESIYNLIPPQCVAAKKDSMYRSKHDAKRPPSYSTFGVAGSARTVANASGSEELVKAASTKLAASGKADPKKFLRKGASQSPADGPATFTRADEALKKPSVPTREDKPIMGLKSEKNFVVSNAVECILSVPKKRPEVVTTAVAKSDYGQVPKYLHKARAELQKQYEANATQAKDTTIPKEDNLRKLAEPEMKELMEGLKRRWAECNRAFQTMSFSMETTTQIHRRDALEREMKQLEDAMKKLNKPFLFVYDDTPK